MARYRAVIDAGGDPAEIGAWISEARAQRLNVEADLRRAATRTRMTRQQITDLITEAGDIAATLRATEPGTTADAYKKLGLSSLTTQTGRSSELRRARSGTIWANGLCPRGADPIPHIALSATAPREINL